MAQCFREPGEDPGSVHSTHIVITTITNASSKGIRCYLLTSVRTTHTWATQKGKHAGKIFMDRPKNKFLKKNNLSNTKLALTTSCLDSCPLDTAAAQTQTSDSKGCHYSVEVKWPRRSPTATVTTNNNRDTSSYSSEVTNPKRITEVHVEGWLLLQALFCTSLGCPRLPDSDPYITPTSVPILDECSG